MSAKSPALDQVIQAISAVVTVKPESIRMETRLIADLGLESIDIVDVIFELEKIAGAELSLMKAFQADRLRTETGSSDLLVGDIVRYIENKKVQS